MGRIKDHKHLIKLSNTFVDNHSVFKPILDQYKTPPIWGRQPTYETLVHVILEQQVSLASAKACLEKLRIGIKKIEPKKFLKCTPEELLSYGFSRQKVRYCRLLAEAILNKDIELKKLGDLSMDDCRSELIKLKGIGPWTAEVWLLMVDNRADAFPAGDIALQQSWKDLVGLEKRPNTSEMEVIAEDWRPMRAVAARLLWWRYLNQ